MSVGFPPFYMPKQKIPDLVNRIKTHDPPLHYINDPVLKDFLKKVLQKQPTERLGFKDAKQIKKHPWMSDIPWEKLMKK
jgi:serine/threonine protein kinase